MLRQSPELYQELLESLCVDRKNEIPPGKLPYYKIPVFNFHKASFQIQISTLAREKAVI
jgi:hypothetical protein